LSASDPRVRRIPFVTQRPTFSETKRVARVLATAFELDATVLEAEAAAQKQAAGAQDLMARRV
jgi:hypothetical protein